MCGRGTSETSAPNRGSTCRSYAKLIEYAEIAQDKRRDNKKNCQRDKNGCDEYAHYSPECF